MVAMASSKNRQLTDDVLGESTSDHREQILVLAHQVASGVDLVAEADLDPVRTEVVAVGDHEQVQIGHLHQQHRPARFGLDALADRVLAESRQLLFTHLVVIRFLLVPKLIEIIRDFSRLFETIRDYSKISKSIRSSRKLFAELEQCLTVRF